MPSKVASIPGPIITEEQVADFIQDMPCGLHSAATNEGGGFL